MKQLLTFYSHGKLLLSGEYLVIDGALSLALPARLGQSLHVEIAEGPSILSWESHVKGNQWFTCSFRLPDLETMTFSDQAVADRLQILLRNAAAMNPKTLGADMEIKAVADIGFDLNFGLGTSSTLISNLAYWFDVDPFQLFWSAYPGSGYDIACARSPQAILYRIVENRPEIKHVAFAPPFRDHLYFVHLGQKQDTLEGIRHYHGTGKASSTELEQISSISGRLCEARDLREFEILLSEHEQILSRILGMEPVRQDRFSDFPGMVKSLGAWGGDFILVTWSGTWPELQRYFHLKGLRTIFPYHELIL